MKVNEGTGDFSRNLDTNARRPKVDSGLSCQKTDRCHFTWLLLLSPIGHVARL